MKKRNRAGDRRGMFARREKSLEALANRGWRKRKTWTFERLEERNLFSTTPLNLQMESISSATPEGAYELLLRELQWYAMQPTAANDSLATYSLPTDPLFPFQWHLLNGQPGQQVGNPDYQVIYGVAGEDINVTGAWDMGYTGKGVVVAVLDSGVQTNHPDLIANMHPTLGFDAITGDNNANPRFSDPGTAHGTAVAGLIAAVANNGIGGVGVAYDAQIVPIRLIDLGASPQSSVDAFRYATDQIDITNNSWGPAAPRVAAGPSEADKLALRDSILFGRDGKGIIHVFASGNSAGPFFSEGFQDIGNYDSATYDGWVNSRYTIGVTGVDHDGLYRNVDGTFTAYPEISTSVLIAAPTGSNAALNLGEDTGLGSGIYTTDLTGDNGYNMGPLPGGFELDRDFLGDTDYTSRFNGTSAAAPIATGVIALMLEANPDLTWRDVQEILVRSARQNAQFEFPSSGFYETAQNTWQVNQTGIFRDPDVWDESLMLPPSLFVRYPTADPNLFNHYSAEPQLYTNGAGYTFSQGYGVYAEMTGFAHGVVDAELAVKMAEQWTTLNQTLRPELSFSTFVTQPSALIPAAEKGNQESGFFLVPGGIGGRPGFIDYWNEYFADNDPEDEEDGPFSGDDPPQNTRGSFIPLTVPDDATMTIESVDIRVDISGPSEDLDALRILLVSPDGTHHELNHFYVDPSFIPFSTQTNIPGAINPQGNINADEGNFTWTFNTVKAWGERSDDAVIMNPLTGEPEMFFDPISGDPIAPMTRGWELHIENWSGSDFTLAGLEVVWHGQPIGANTERVQGFVGIDENDDKAFNFSRTLLTQLDIDGDETVVRHGEVHHQLDLTQEKFAANILVEAYAVVDGKVLDNPTAQFLTGADGNYYFDLVPGEYEIRITDPLGREAITDEQTEADFRRHYSTTWRIDESWFAAADHDELAKDIYGKPQIKADVDGSPVPLLNAFGEPMVMGIRNLNFLLDPGDVPPNSIEISGMVIADLNGNGRADGDDTGVGEVVVYFDQNRNGVFDAGEISTLTSVDDLTRGQYTLTLPDIVANGTYSIGVVKPNSDWEFTNPTDGTLEIFAGPGYVATGQNFFIDPPADAEPGGGGNVPGDIFGVVFHDRDGDRTRDPGEEGVLGFRVFIDANENGVWDDGETYAVTSSNGSYVLTNVAPGTVRIDVELVDGSPWEMTAPVQGFREVALGSGGTVQGVHFGVKNLAVHDWGGLEGYPTTLDEDGPRHFIVDGFHLGSKVYGEVDGVPTPNANGGISSDDDGIEIVSNGGILQPGANILRVTVAGVGGLLQGWMDFNNDGDWDDPGEQVFVNVDLNPGTHFLTVNAPANLVGGTIASRFRWGTPNLGYTGPSPLGEVEDYRLPSAASLVQVAGDYNLNGVVDQADHAVWMSTFGSESDLRADGNHDNVINAADYTIWRDNLGAGFGSAQGATAGGSAVEGSGSTTTTPAPVYGGPIIMPLGFLSGLSAQQLEQSGLGDILDRLLAQGVIPQSFVAMPGTAGSGSAVAQGNVPYTDPGPGAAAFTPSTGDIAPDGRLLAFATHSVVDANGAAGPVFGSALQGFVDSDLELLDTVLSQFGNDEGEEEAAPLLFEEQDDEQSAVADLALASLFEQETDWRPLG